MVASDGDIGGCVGGGVDGETAVGGKVGGWVANVPGVYTSVAVWMIILESSGVSWDPPLLPSGLPGPLAYAFEGWFEGATVDVLPYEGENMNIKV